MRGTLPTSAYGGEDIICASLVSLSLSAPQDISRAFHPKASLSATFPQRVHRNTTHCSEAILGIDSRPIHIFTSRHGVTTSLFAAWASLQVARALSAISGSSRPQSLSATCCEAKFEREDCSGWMLQCEARAAQIIPRTRAGRRTNPLHLHPPMF